MPLGPKSAARDGGAAVDDDHLAGHERARGRGEKDGGAGDLIRLADPSQRRRRRHRLQRVRVLPQGAGEVRAHEAGRDAVDADVVTAELDREIAGELEVRGLGDVVGPDHRRALRPPIEDTITTEPSLRSIIPGAAIWTSQWFASTLLSRIFRNWSSEMPPIGPK